MRSVVGAVVVVAACGLASCATQMYKGPRRANGEVAVVGGDGIWLAAVDGRNASFKIEVLPGLHDLAVELNDTQGPAAERIGDLRNHVYFSRGRQEVCFVALAGHAYRVRPVYGEGHWRPEIVDETVAELVRSWPPRAGASCKAGPGRTGGE